MLQMLTTLQDDNNEWQQIMAAGDMTFCVNSGVAPISLLFSSSCMEIDSRCNHPVCLAAIIQPDRVMDKPSEQLGNWLKMT